MIGLLLKKYISVYFILHVEIYSMDPGNVQWGGAHRTYALEFLPEHFKTQEICNEVVKADPYTLQYVPDNLKTHEMFISAVEKYLYSLRLILDHLRTKMMCERVVEEEPDTLEFIPD